ncbi:MAG: radical SAM protein [Candidatus Njordarchaeales archaeon]
MEPLAEYTRKRIFKITPETDIPLMGCIAFGLIDRGTNLIQVRPVTTCPLSCIFCATDAGPRSRNRQTEYIVELDYLVEEFRKLVMFKGPKKIEAHIDTVGDPLTYPRIVELVQELSETPGVDVISLQTHGVLLTEKLVDELDAAGLSRINLSIDSLDPDLAKYLSNTPSYNLDKVLGIAEYIANSSGIDLLIAPVWVPGINDSEIPKIIEFALRIGAGKRWPPLGIQKYIPHKRGRKPKNVKAMSWSRFYKQLRIWEKKYGVKLILKPEDFGIHRRKSLKAPFKIGEVVRATVVAPGWLKNEVIGRAKGFCITIVNATIEEIPIGTDVFVKIEKTKHNILIGKLAR